MMDTNHPIHKLLSPPDSTDLLAYLGIQIPLTTGFDGSGFLFMKASSSCWSSNDSQLILSVDWMMALITIAVEKSLGKRNNAVEKSLGNRLCGGQKPGE
jgi:hypothetical protein